MPIVNGKYVSPYGGGAKPRPQASTTKAGASQQPAPVAAPSFQLPSSDWNYKTAKLGRNGESLPQGATAWTPQGTPYFGDGTLVGDVLGKLKEYSWNFTKDYQAPAGGAPTWDIVKTAWNTAFKPPTDQPTVPANATTGEKFKAAGQYLEQKGLPKLFNAVNQTWEYGKSQLKQGEVSGPLRPGVYNTLTGLLTTAFDLVQQGAMGLEAGVGAYEGLVNSDVQSPLPKFNNAVMQAIPPLNIAYNLLRTALSPSDNKWQSVSEGFQAGKIEWTQVWNMVAANVDAKVQAGNIFYSQELNNTVKEEFVRRMRAGENPDLLAMELGNPLAEMAGQMLVDPLNLLGAVNKGAKAEKILSENADLIAHTGALANPEIAALAEDLAKATDLTKADEGVTKLAQASMDSARTVENGLSQSYKPTSLIATGNQEHLLKNNGIAAQNLLDTLGHAGYSTDDAGRMILSGVQSVSGNLEEAKLGAVGILHSPSPSMLFSSPYQALFTTVRNLIKDENGVIDAEKFLGKLKGNSPQEFIDNVAKMLDDSVKSQYPTVDEMYKASMATKKAGVVVEELPTKTQRLAKAYNELPIWVKKFTGAVQPEQQLKGFVNKQLGTFYFGLQYSVAARNITNNTVQILIDQGTGVFYRDGKFWSLGALKKDNAAWIGSEKPFGGGGFEDFANELGMTAPAAKPKGGVLQFAKENLTPRAVMSNSETDAGLRVFTKQFTDTMKKLINPKFMGGDVLTAGNMATKEQNTLFRLLYEAHGDPRKASQMFRELHAGGSIDAWRTIDAFMGPEQLNHLDEIGLRGELSDLLNNPNTTLEDVTKWVDQTEKAQVARAGMAVDDVPGVPLNADGGLDMQVLQDAVERGDIKSGDNAVLSAYLTDANKASNSYFDTLEQTFNSVIRGNADNPEIQKLVNMKETVMRFLREDGQNTRAATDGMRRSMKFNYDLVHNSHKPDVAWLQLKWKQFGIAGDAPETLTKKDLISALMEHYRKSVANAWNDHFTGLFAGKPAAQLSVGAVDVPSAEDMVKEFGKYTDPAKLEQDFQEAQKAWTRAQAYRTGSFKDGLYVTIPGEKPAEGLVPLYNTSGRTATEEAALPGRWATDKPISDASSHGERSVAYVTPKQREDAKDWAAADHLAKHNMRIDASGNIVPMGRSSALPASIEEIHAAIQKLPEGRNTPSIVGEIGEIQNESYTYKMNADWRPVGAGEMKVPPPYVDGSIPSVPRAMKENLNGTLDTLENVRNSVTARWGQKVAAPLGTNIEKTLSDWTTLVDKRMPEAKFIAQKTGSYWRDFALHSYGEKTYLDLAASYVYPYQFWYSRTYAKWMQRVVTDPQIIAGYAKYKSYMAKVHADAPDWYKQQVNVGELIGLDKNHPLYFNLESNLWPLYGLTGVDFNDNKKRVDWWTSTLDDMNKMGPSVWAPIQIATAVGLLTAGQTDAASRWGGRLIPETATLKALYNLGNGKFLPDIPGTGIKYGELDPSVNLFSGGIDPYARGQVGAAMADSLQKQLEEVMNSPVSPELKSAQIGTLRAQYIDQANSQTGDLWDQGVRDASNLRAPGQISSYLFGVGMKARTGTDASIDAMYAKLNQIYLTRDSMSAEQYRKAYSDLGREFPFMDTVLMSRKGGPERDAAYAYNVIGRIPPGDTTALLKTAGLSSAEIDKFFETKGFTDTNIQFSNAQRNKFMSAMQELGAVLKLPSDATRQEWDAAKAAYQKMMTGIDTGFGSDVVRTVNAYYDLQASGNKQKSSDFKLQHPEITAYLTAKQETVLSDPSLARYYGSLDTLESYVEGQFKLQMFAKYGSDILQKQQRYYDLKDYNSNYMAKEYLRTHPELKRYWDDNRNSADLMNRRILELSKYLPAQPTTGARSDLTNPSATQEQITKMLNTSQAPSFDRVSQMIPSPVLRKVIEYYRSGTPLSASVSSEMDYLASTNGFYDGQDLLRYVGASLWGQ